MAFDVETQFGPTPDIAGVLAETGDFTLDETNNEVSGDAFTTPSKLHRIKGGFGYTSDGCLCLPTLGVLTGKITWQRLGTYVLTEPRFIFRVWGT